MAQHLGSTRVPRQQQQSPPPHPALPCPDPRLHCPALHLPSRDHVLVNKVIPASTAFLYATCLQHHVPQDVDLVTLEFTVNESPKAPYTSPERRSYEQLIRRLLKLPGRPAVMLLHHYAYWEAHGDGLDRGLFYREPEGQLTAFAQYYDLPALSVRAAAWHLMKAGIDRFKVDRVARQTAHRFLLPNGTWQEGFIPIAAPDNATAKAALFYVDGTHPSDHGHKVLAELLAAPLMRAVWEATAGDGLSEADHRRHPGLADLPAPMIPDTVDEIPGVCAMLEEFKPTVKNQSGFEYLPERPKADDFVKQKWGWRGTEPGAWAELEVDTRAHDSSDQQDTLVWLSHLRSYQGMGTARVRCVSGCTCQISKLDGTWQMRHSLFWFHRFQVSRHKRCRFRVTLTDKPGEFPEEGHKVTLVAVMVTHVPLAGAGSLGLVHVSERDKSGEKRRLD